MYANAVIRGDCREVAGEFARLCGVRQGMPDLALLRTLTREFGRLPYENFTKVLRAAGHEDPLQRLRTPEVVLSEHLERGAGGTCFSLTHFFRRVLEFFGFDAAPVLCDRSYGPGTHCALIVRAGCARFLVDPGYLMQEPIEIPEHGASLQRGLQGALTLTRLGRSSQLLLISESEGGKKIRYRLRDRPVSDEEFLARWIDSFEWPMMRHLCVSRQTAEGQLYMRDGRVRRVRGGDRNQVRLGSDFAEEVERAFGVDRRLVSMARDALATIRNVALTQRFGCSSQRGSRRPDTAAYKYRPTKAPDETASEARRDSEKNTRSVASVDIKGR
ncbi:MAG: arylamine N-acetyltransferase [Proteobacteria bacterium]|nr:arylamine N-acetyltransferase [Pseudomonadota bacterium]